jgi:hypothetical protein
MIAQYCVHIFVNIHRRGGLNPPEPAVTTLGVIHPQYTFQCVIGQIQSAPTVEGLTYLFRRFLR